MKTTQLRFLIMSASKKLRACMYSTSNMQVQKISWSKCMHKLSGGASTATKIHNAPFIFAWKQRLRFVDEFLHRPAVVLCGVGIVNSGQHNAAKSIICSRPSSKRRPVVGPYADPRYQDRSPDTWSTSWYSPWYQPGQLPAQQWSYKRRLSEFTRRFHNHSEGPYFTFKTLC